MNLYLSHNSAGLQGLIIGILFECEEAPRQCKVFLSGEQKPVIVDTIIVKQLYSISNGYSIADGLGIYDGDEEIRGNSRINISKGDRVIATGVVASFWWAYIKTPTIFTVKLAK